MSGTCYPKVKRAKPEPSSQWYFTFAGLMVALMTFLVLILSVSNIEKAKFRMVGSSLQDAFALGKGRLLNAWPFGDTFEVFEFQRAVKLVRMKEKLKNSLSDLIDDGKAVLSETEGGFLVEIDTDILFRHNSLALHPKIKNKMHKVAKLLASVPNLVYVTGHTDNVAPPSKTPFQSNWSLSAVYAATIVDYLIEKGGVDARRLQARAMGQHAPRQDNASEEGRAQNRRIEILVTHKILLTNVKSLEEQAVILLSNEGYGLSAMQPKSLRISSRLWTP